MLYWFRNKRFLRVVGSLGALCTGLVAAIQGSDTLEALVIAVVPLVSTFIAETNVWAKATVNEERSDAYLQGLLGRTDD